MKLTAFGIIFFFICLNLSFYVINEGQLFPYYIEGTETPTSIQENTYNQLVTSGVIFVGGLLVSIALNVLTYGATVALLMAVLSYISPTVSWVLTGFPQFLLAIGVPTLIYTAILTIFMLTFFWFLLGIIAQRYME